jgi:hypothetical protein
VRFPNASVVCFFHFPAASIVFTALAQYSVRVTLPSGSVTDTVRPLPSYPYVVHSGDAPGACGRAVRNIFPNGVHPHGAYSVSATDTVVVPFPVSTLIARPNPSKVVFVQRPASSAFCVFGLYVYV